MNFSIIVEIENAPIGPKIESYLSECLSLRQGSVLQRSAFLGQDPLPIGQISYMG